MSDLRKVKPGDPLKVPAATFNAFVDAAADFQRRQRDQGGGDLRTRPDLCAVPIKNNSGGDLNRFAVVGIDSPIFTPTDNEDAFKNRVALVGVTPTVALHAGRFAIILEPIANGKIGQAAVAGVCPVQINVAAVTDTFADVTNSDSTALTSGSFGGATILWRATGTGPQWAIVRFGGGAAASTTPAGGFVGIVTDATPLNTPPNSATYSYTVARATKNGTGWFAGDSSDGWTAGDSVTAYNMAESDLFYADNNGTPNVTRTCAPTGAVVWVMPISDDATPPNVTYWFNFWQQDFFFGRITAAGGDGTYTIQPVRKTATGVAVGKWEDYSTTIAGVVNVAESGLVDNVGNPATYCTPVESNRIVKVYNLLLKNDTATTRTIEAYIDEPPPPICPEYCTGGAQGALLYWDTTATKWKTLCPPGVDSVLSISAAGVLSWLPTTSSCP